MELDFGEAGWGMMGLPWKKVGMACCWMLEGVFVLVKKKVEQLRMLEEPLSSKRDHRKEMRWAQLGKTVRRSRRVQLRMG